MLTPNDKVMAGGNDIIQIVVTRKCDVHTCSNCTQLLPFRRDETEMTLECAEAALRSVADWPGVVAMFGGNPCTHSRFPELARLWAKYVPEQRRRGLWTNDVRGHGVIVRDVWYPYGRFNLNVHGSGEAARVMREHLPKARVFGERPSHHGAVYGDHAALGVVGAEWEAAREGCDINRNWSAGVYGQEMTCQTCGGDGFYRTDDPAAGLVNYSAETKCGECNGSGQVQRPFAYFCEVAGAIDGVTGERNGVPAVPGWWRQPIADFKAQVERCCDRHCLVPLRLKGHDDSEATYDTSPGSPLLTIGRRGKVSVAEIGGAGERIRELTDYQHLRSTN